MTVILRHLGAIVFITAIVFGCGNAVPGGSGTGNSQGDGGGDVTEIPTDAGAGQEDGSSGGTSTDASTGQDAAVADGGNGAVADGAVVGADVASDAGAAVDTATASDAGAGAAADSGSASSDAGGNGSKVCTYDASKGPDGSECPSGQGCLVGVGKCAGLVIGQCAKMPAVCPAVVASVCGCDGSTYNSLCDAQVAGVIVKTGGKCAAPDVLCGGKYGQTCKSSQICDPTCGIDGVGICRETPGKMCPNGGTPECGCDGKTYPNPCFRQQAKVGLAHQGKCPTGNTAITCKIGPVKPVLCSVGFYCQMNTAGACSGKGKCQPIPPVCDATKKPVCGCDKNTYGNACKLAQSGFSLLAVDACK